MKINDLISLQNDELDDQFGWIDWRAYETEVIEVFKDQLGAEAPLDYEENEVENNVESEAKSNEKNQKTIIVKYQNQSFPIPLTHTGCDRYVMINSLAEIIKDTHVVWHHRSALDGDTHGLLVLPKDFSKTLKKEHPEWVKKHLRRLTKGKDEFNGLKVPYVGHEDNAPDFDREYAAIKDIEDARNAHMDHIARERAIERKKAKRMRIIGSVIGGVMIVIFALAIYDTHKKKKHCSVRINGKCLVYVDENGKRL